LQFAHNSLDLLLDVDGGLPELDDSCFDQLSFSVHEQFEYQPLKHCGSVFARYDRCLGLNLIGVL
jgi:hypothetical protein